MNDKHKENVREELEKRGFSLELDSYRMLRKHGWLSALQSFFADVPVSAEERTILEAIRDLWRQPTKPTYRTVDVTGLKFIPSELDDVSSALITLIMECKWRAKENWVFYVESVDQNQYLNLFQRMTNLDTDKDRYDAIGSLAFGEISTFGNSRSQKQRNIRAIDRVNSLGGTSHHALRNLREIALSHTHVFTAPKHDNVRKACLQVLRASIYYGQSLPVVTEEQLREKEPFLYWRFYPVVVFSSDIWAAKYDKRNKLNVEKKGWITYLFPYEGSLHSVDIVSANSLDGYLSMIDEEIEQLKRMISENKG